MTGMKKSIVGIDIGGSEIRAAEVQDPHKDSVVLRHGEITLPDGAVIDGDVVEINTVADALRRLWKSSGFKSKDVVLGVGNHKVLARELTVAKMPLKLIRESLPFQVQELLPVPVEDALLDFYPVSEEEDSPEGAVIHGLLIAAVRESVEAKVAAARLAGLNPVGVDIVPFALARILLSSELKARGSIALVDIGEGTTIVVVAKNGIPEFIRIIPVGGGDVTRALANRLGVDLPEAERLKRTVGLVASPKGPEGLSADVYETVLEIVFSETSEMLSGLRNTLSYHLHNSGDSLDRILLTGGTGKMPGFAEALAELTRIPVGEGNPLGRITLSRPLRESASTTDWAALTVALGLTSGASVR
jgi:type IV pilus assembly protein PilM